MRRSVTMAGVVAAVMLTAPMAAMADVGPPVTAAAAAPVDCPEVGPGAPAGGDPAQKPEKPKPEEKSGEQKPAEDKPAGDTSGEQKPAEQKPEETSAEKPAEATSGEQKSDDTSGEQKPADEKADKKASGGGSASEGGVAPAAPAAPQAAGEDPGDDTSGEQKPADDTSGGDTKSEEKPADEKKADEKKVDDTSGQKPAEDKPEQKPADDPSGEQKPADSSGAEKPAEKPADEKPADAAGDGDSGAVGKPAPGPANCDAPATPAAPADPGAPAGAATSAATMHNWGTPNRVDEFDKDLSGWSMYDGEGHAGNGKRSPDAASVKDGLLTINGDGKGTTAGMAWNPGQKYGRWEGRVKAPASDPSYNALLLLWPDAENFPVGGEVDFMEMTDHTRKKTELFLHHGEDNNQVQGDVDIDATQWHNWAVEWTPEHITAFVDGKEWWTTKDTSILPPDAMHLCIQLDWFPKGGGDVKPSEMQVDWVRQYALPESEQGGGSDDKDKDKAGSEGLLDGLGDRLGDLTRRTEGAPDPGQTGAAQRGPSAVTGTP